MLVWREALLMGIILKYVLKTGYMDYINMDQDSVQWRIIVNKGVKL
jgi:hypothetical protein